MAREELQVGDGQTFSFITRLDKELIFVCNSLGCITLKFSFTFTGNVVCVLIFLQ